MNKFIGILLALFIVSCQEKQPENSITGTAKGVKDGVKIYVSTIGENNRPIPVDTAVVKKEHFTFNLKPTETQRFNNFSMENARGNKFFIWANEPLTVELYKDSLYASSVLGGKHNALLAKYSDHLQQYGKSLNNLRNQMRVNINNPQKIKELRMEQQALQDENVAFRKEIVANNPNSLMAVMALSDLLRMNALPVAESKKMYNSLSEEVKNTFLAEKIKEQLDAALVTAIGSKAPNFSAPTPNGETLTLKDAMGKVTLIDFWASWCKPCRKENPNIVRVYEKYHDKGLNIIGVSLDKSKGQWLAAIKADNLQWKHVSNLQFWNEPIAKKYSVRSIPKAFLLDENGVIVAKDLRGQALEDKVA
ncbi:MAG TPA: TlpA disulfide reductase family protein, partial [Flavobacteriaceae bacterium]|nr:TlpA disulfide reductase family protein [Flavobacteriaceae bacterium]